jgi:uncharacterized protein
MFSNARLASWVQEILASLAVASGVGYLATIYGVSRWLTRPSRAISLRPSPETWRDCTWEDLECTTGDGFRLAGWAISPPYPKATVAIFHGMRGNRSRTLDRIGFLTRAGYRCVAFDHRAHGQSDGRVTTFGYREGGDVAAVLQLIQRNWPHQPRAALGISMGAAAICYSAEQSRNFDAIILESPYHDLTAAFLNRIGKDFPSWFGKFVKGTIWLTERRMGLRMSQMAPHKYIGRLAPTPVMLLAGEQDPHAPPEETELLFQCCGAPSELHYIPEAGHHDVFDKGGQYYQDLIIGFLEQRLARRRAA